MTPYEADILFKTADDKGQIIQKAKIGAQTWAEWFGLAVLIKLSQNKKSLNDVTAALFSVF